MRKFLVLVIILLFVIGTFFTSCSPSVPNEEQIKADLLGHQIASGLLSWRFDTLSEFESFNVVGKREQTEVLEYEVTMRLRDFDWGFRYLLDAYVTYKKVNGGWQLKTITPKLFRML